MPAITYKCPNCGGELTFDPRTGRCRCEYCQSDFSLEEIEQANPGAAEAVGEEEQEKPYADEQTGGAVVYTCPNCGAEIVTDETTAAAVCFYCHNPVVLSGRLSGEYLPDRVIPFAIDRKEAAARFRDCIAGKHFLPRAFFSEEQMQLLSGVYFPYWIYGGSFDAELRARGRRIRTWFAGDIEYTETSSYAVERGGSLALEGIARNALEKADKDLIECVQPYDLGNLQPFSLAYLSGFQAEKRNIGREILAPEMTGERDQMIGSVLRGEAGDYMALEAENISVRPLSERWEYALFPVWTLTYPGRDGKIYYYAMNGQTGQINGDFPVDKGKAALLSVCAGLVVFVLMLVGGYLL